MPLGEIQLTQLYFVILLFFYIVSHYDWIFELWIVVFLVMMFLLFLLARLAILIYHNIFCGCWDNLFNILLEEINYFSPNLLTGHKWVSIFFHLLGRDDKLYTVVIGLH